MVVIRLARTGAKKAPFYHVVAADRREPRDGRYLERLGYFNPMARGQEVRLELQKDRIEHWVGLGAQPSGRVSHLLKIFEKMAGEEAKPLPTMAELKQAQIVKAAESAKKRAAAEKAEAEAAAKVEAEAKKAEEAEAKKAEEATPAEEKKAEVKEAAPADDKKADSDKADG